MQSAILEAAALCPREDAQEPEWISRAADIHGWAWARIAWQRAVHVRGAWFDHAKAQAIVEIWPSIFRLTEDRFAGQPFILAFWQEVIVRLLTGWKLPVEVQDPATGKPSQIQARLFRRLMLWVPRKNGKSEFLAALALLFWAVEGVIGGQGYVFARDEKQAKIVLDKMKTIIAQDKRLAGAVTMLGKSLWIAEKRAAFMLLSGRPEGKHGRSPTVSVGDEMHEWVTRELATTIRQGMGARLQPIELFASTAGLKSARTGYELFDESQKILSGPIEPPSQGADRGEGLYDPSTLVVLFAALEEDDWQDEQVWARANPNLGLSPILDFLRREAEIAKVNPRAESAFRRYHLNQWVESLARWIKPARWDACASDRGAWKTAARELKGRRCYGGFDKSSTIDITALVWWFPPIEGDERHRLVCRFWVPADNIELRSTRDRVSYDRWLKIGALESTPGDYIDQGYMEAAIEEGLETYDVVKIGYDSWDATGLYTNLVAKGVPPGKMVKVIQGIRSMGEASKDFERIVYASLLDHGGHPVLRWMLGNTVIHFDRNMNFRPDKERSREKIDGIVAAIIARAVMLADGGGETVKHGYLDI